MDSFSCISDSEFIKLRNAHNFILPNNNSHKNLVFTFVITNENASHCILFELSEENFVLPSVIMVPDVYLTSNLFRYAIDFILLPACFKNPQNASHQNEKLVLAVDYNGKKETNKTDGQDGLHLIFLLKLNESNLIETNNLYQWKNIDLNEDIKQKLNQPFHFITLKLL